MVNVTEELLLLAYDDVKGVDNSYTSLGYGMAGAVLLDLTLQNRIEIQKDRIVAIDTSPVGNPVLDEALEQIAASKPKKPTSWLSKLYWGIPKRVRAGLVDQGVLRYEKGWWLGFIPYPRYLPNDPMVKRDVLERLENATRRGYTNDSKTAALAGMLHVLWMEKKAVPSMPRSQARKALKVVARQSPDTAINASLKANRDAVNAAVIAAVAAAVAAAAAGGSA